MPVLKWTAALASLALLASPLAAQEIVEREGEEDVIFTPTDDPAMTEARNAARASLPHFWEKLESTPVEEADFLIKAGLPTIDGGLEHIWTGAIQKQDDGAITGILANEPLELAGDLSFGDPVTFTSDDITDWTYLDGEKYRGHFTTRVLATYMPEEDVADLYGFIHLQALPDTSTPEDTQ